MNSEELPNNDNKPMIRDLMINEPEPVSSAEKAMALKPKAASPVAVRCLRIFIEGIFS